VDFACCSPEFLNLYVDAEQLLVFLGQELHSHAVEFLRARALVVPHRADHDHTGFQNVGPEHYASVQVFRVASSEQDEWVQIAVIGVGHKALESVLLLYDPDGL
jgi:hypothetical protein